MDSIRGSAAGQKEPEAGLWKPLVSVYTWPPLSLPPFLPSLAESHMAQVDLELTV